MHKLESVLEKQRNKIFWDFQIQMDHSILVRSLDLVLINKKERTDYLVVFAVPMDHRVKTKESKKIN